MRGPEPEPAGLGVLPGGVDGPVEQVEAVLGGERHHVAHEHDGRRVHGVRPGEPGPVRVHEGRDALVVGRLDEGGAAQPVRVPDRHRPYVPAGEGAGQPGEPVGGRLQQGDAERGSHGIGERRPGVQMYGGLPVARCGHPVRYGEGGRLHDVQPAPQRGGAQRTGGRGESGRKDEGARRTGHGRRSSRTGCAGPTEFPGAGCRSPRAPTAGGPLCVPAGPASIVA